MPNRLAEEKSPYLLQHKDNPVDWYPWSEEAFDKARKEDIPVFVSIGYSTCHWCHVMEKESFEDEEIAKLLNDNFVSIKVDREERPDIDGIYMSVCQLMTGSGGWPLTVILTPDKKPFFSGTYFPKESKYGRAGLGQILSRVTELWNDKRSELLSSADKITESLHEISDSDGNEEIIPELIDSGYHQFQRNFDKLKGGFGPAPKFPSAHNLLFLMRYWKQSREQDALEMTVKTLLEMRRGGIYDHIGYGFHRYSTDKNWLLPHFEKMLYDQAMMMLAYTEAYQITKHRVFKETVYEIAAYVKRNLTSPEGAFYSAEDADSEGVEGKFYLWSYDELKGALGDDFELIAKLYNIEKEGNYIDPAEGGKTGKNILYTNENAGSLPDKYNLNEDELREKISRANKILFEKREQRVHPHLDDKVLTDWNGLMIAALAKAGSVFDDNTFSDMAEKAASFIVDEMHDENNELLHRYRDGEAAIPATLDDYSFMIWGLTELYQSVFKTDYLRTAVELNDYMIAHFYDDKKSGFYIAADNAAEEIVRQKTAYDGAVPSGNSAAVYNLIRLASLTGGNDYRELAGKTADHFASAVQELPSAYSFLLSAVSFLFSPISEVVITGSGEEEEVQQMLEQLRNNYLPETVTILKDKNNADEIGEIAPFTRLHNRLNDKAAAYVWKNQNCRLPVTDSAEMIDLINRE